MNGDPQPLPKFAEQLTKEIKNSPFTAKKVFEMVGLPPVYLSRWRKDNLRAPTYLEVCRFAKILDIPIEILMYGRIDRPYVKIPLVEYKSFLNKIETTVTIQKEKLEDRIM